VWIDDIANLLRWHDLADVVLAGHGHGGVVAAGVSQYAARRLARLVFLDSPLPENGRSVRDLVPADVRARLGGDTRPGAWLGPRRLTPGDGLDPAAAAWAGARMTPSPARPDFDPVRVTEPEALDVPRHHVFCARTPASYPATFTRLRLETEGEPYEIIDAGHDAPLSAPGAVADLLDRLAGADRDLRAS
jgi:pimeloyl-ACP methyl ester carboxylesterase